MTNKRRPTVTVMLEGRVEERLQQIQDAYGSMCCRASVAKTAMEIGLLVMAVRAAALNDKIKVGDYEKVQLGKIMRELPEERPVQS
jgi:hypothetical protein